MFPHVLIYQLHQKCTLGPHEMKLKALLEQLTSKPENYCHTHKSNQISIPLILSTFLYPTWHLLEIKGKKKRQNLPQDAEQRTSEID